MDPFKLRKVKVDKANAILKYRRLRQITHLFRLVEICAVLVLISRLSAHLPDAVKNSGEYFRDLSVILASPRFVFILGNLIVIILFAKSGQFSGQDSAMRSSSFDLYQEFVKKSERRHGIHRDVVRYREQQSITETKNREKQRTSEAKQGETQSTCEEKNREKQNIFEERVVANTVSASREIKSYQRTRSENLRHVTFENFAQLRRSQTEKFTESSESNMKLVNISYPEDSMSNEEFRNKVEEFIARQKRFRKDEEYSVI